jgi:hypothetical protein
MSVFPNAHQSRHLTNYIVGASAIYAVSRDFNLMLEALAGWNEDIADGVFAFQETVERSTTAIISPGVRYPFNLPNDAQLVIGAALHHRSHLRFIRLGHVLLLLIRACVRASGRDQMK